MPKTLKMFEVIVKCDKCRQTEVQTDTDVDVKVKLQVKHKRARRSVM